MSPSDVTEGNSLKHKGRAGTLRVSLDQGYSQFPKGRGILPSGEPTEILQSQTGLGWKVYKSPSSVTPVMAGALSTVSGCSKPQCSIWP